MSSILTPLDATCLTCHFFVDGSDEEEAFVRGFCHRHAPAASGWPVVAHSDSCGDWQTDYRPILR
jgi:hypothetical protein